MTTRDEILRQLLTAGEMLANCAFNLKQPSCAPTDRDREVLDQCQREWDRLRGELKSCEPRRSADLLDHFRAKGF